MADIDQQRPSSVPVQGGIVALLRALAERTRLQGEGSYSGTKDYGNDWSGSNAGAGGQMSTEIPIRDYILSLMAQGYGFRNQVTSPENNQDIYSGGKVVGGSAGITDPRGRSLSLDYDRNRPRKFMLRGKVPF